MSPLPSDGDPFDGEEDLRTDVHLAIDLALKEIFDKRDREITEIEEEKLTYFAIKNFDLDLTYSWYLAGANTKVSYGTSLTAKPGTERYFGSLQSETPYTDRLNKLRDFFENEVFFGDYSLRKIWWEDRFSFLRDFYQEFAPEKYRDLYIISTNIKEKLYNIDKLIETESKNTTLSDFDGGGSDALLPPPKEKEIRYLISDLHLELSSIEELSDTKAVVASGTDLIEQILYKLSQKETTTQEQRRILDELHDFFYYYVWKYPALLISADKACGPNAKALKFESLREFNGFEKQVEEEREKLANWCYKADLLPNIEDYTSLDIDEESDIILPNEQANQDE
ncbi:hypothetical protein [Halorussus lipolyticus]|uniref:hypothetical protein n=1 Tax=Halorussus lipolyticus TaxID=3034024 RepID=UPI0023E7664B|nr:hypothetical protein [Halorussus sp. DT80]